MVFLVQTVPLGRGGRGGGQNCFGEEAFTCRKARNPIQQYTEQLFMQQMLPKQIKWSREKSLGNV